MLSRRIIFSYLLSSSTAYAQNKHLKSFADKPGATIFGDLILTQDQYEYFYGSKRRFRRSFVNPSKKWDQYYRNGKYEIAYTLSGFGEDLNKVQSLMNLVEADFSNNTNIRLAEKSNFPHHKDWLQLIGDSYELGKDDFAKYLVESGYTWNTGSGCWSFLGRILYLFEKNGGQPISLKNGCHHQSTISHQILHALGWTHEQNRADRDKYIEVLWDNIIPGYEHQFEILKEPNHFGTPYDVDSIMHYPSDKFSINGHPTMRSKGSVRIKPSSEYNQPRWLNRGLTKYDAFEVNQVYKKMDEGERKIATSTPSAMTKATHIHTKIHPKSRIRTAAYTEGPTTVTLTTATTAKAEVQTK